MEKVIRILRKEIDGNNSSNPSCVMDGILTSETGKILSISKAFPGHVHDFEIRKARYKIPRDVIALVDSGYQGLQKIHEAYKNYETFVPKNY